MKKMISMVIIMVFATLVTQAQEQATKTKTACFKSSMHCDGCQNTIFEVLRFEKGVKDIKTDLSSNTIKVVYDSRKNTPESLAKVIEKKGYKADAISEEEYARLVVPARQEEPSK